MPSEIDAAKKGREQLFAEQFLEARTEAIGQALYVLAADESPDFICTDDRGESIGLEIAQVTHGPIAAHWAAVLDGQNEIPPFDAQALIYNLLQRKEKARQERYSRKVAECILLLVLAENSIPNLRVALDGLEDDFSEHGFSEVWLMDTTEHDAYRTVELFCLSPAAHWGYYRRPNAGSKPYG